MGQDIRIRARLNAQALAYADIKRSADYLLENAHLHRNERLILRLARYLATVRLRQYILEMHSDDAEALLRDL